MRLRVRCLLSFDSVQDFGKKRLMLAIVLGFELLVANAEFLSAVSHQYA